jgi:hypothetical protein
LNKNFIQNSIKLKIKIMGKSGPTINIVGKPSISKVAWT